MSARSIFLYASLAAIVLGRATAVLVQRQASSVPDLAGGRTEPYVFAPALSGAPSYITDVDGWMIAGPYGLAITLFLVWLVLEARHRMGWGR